MKNTKTKIILSLLGLALFLSPSNRVDAQSQGCAAPVGMNCCCDPAYETFGGGLTFSCSIFGCVTGGGGGKCKLDGSPVGYKVTGQWVDAKCESITDTIKVCGTNLVTKETHQFYCHCGPGQDPDCIGFELTTDTWQQDVKECLSTSEQCP